MIYIYKYKIIYIAINICTLYLDYFKLIIKLDLNIDLYIYCH